MAATRRDFLQISATAASALTLQSLTVNAEPDAREPAQLSRNPAVHAIEDKMLRAHPAPLGNVRLTGGPLKHAQDMDAVYLLSLEPDRMLAPYRMRAGLAPKAEQYRGWDGPGRNLTGHIAGHHLSAVSLMFQATGDQRFKERVDVMVAGLKEVQDANKDGYLGALENGREAFARVSKGDIVSAAFDLNGLWSPWYTLHKTFAGLRDAYRHADNRTALDIELKYAVWADSVLAPMSDAQIQRMLNTEHGGMNEVLADLYADTGDKRWLDLSYKFEHRAFTDALKRHQDNLNGKHGNCQIPKLCGSAARYGYTGDTADIMAASFFWDRVAQHHSYATGGHGLAEYFGPADQLSPRVDGRTCESCNVYNMLKLTRRLFSLRPDAFYSDFHERALFNHVLASMDPEDGRTSYMVPVGRGVTQEYQNMQQSFTCCVGSGMESHALHGDGLYYESDDTVWVTLFAPSTVQLPRTGVSLEMQSDFPDGDTASIVVTRAAAKPITLAVRRPSWAGDAFAIKVNGTAIEVPTLASRRPGGAGGRDVDRDDRAPQPSSFVEITRTWKNGDRVELSLPKTVRLEPTPDNKQVAAIMWGPLVLAGDWGPRVEGRGAGGGQAGAPPAPPPPIPLLVTTQAVTDWVQPSARKGDFTAMRVARVPADPTAAPTDVALAPFYRTQRRRYSVYFDVVTPADFDARVAALAAERERRRALEAATVAYIQPGAANEQTYNYQSDPANRPPTRQSGRTGRGGQGSFSWDLPVDAAAPMAVVVTYFNDIGVPPTAGSFQILVDGQVVGTYTPDANATGFFDARYAVPADLTRGKSKVTVKFQATGNRGIAPVFGVRTIRAN